MLRPRKPGWPKPEKPKEPPVGSTPEPEANTPTKRRRGLEVTVHHDPHPPVKPASEPHGEVPKGKP